MKKVIIFCICLYFISAQAKNCDENSIKALIPGHYTVIGRIPNSDITFSSTMDIQESKDLSFKATEKSRGKLIRQWKGDFKKASPGEGCVLHLFNRKSELACLISPDLDITLA